MTFYEKIKEVCKLKGVKMSHIERDLGYGNGYILTLKDKIPTDRAMAIAEYLGLPSDYFLPDELKKDSSKARMNPQIEQIVMKASKLSEKELEELLSFADYILSKH